MRLNKFIAEATGMSRRAADAAIRAGRVTVNGHTAELGQQIGLDDKVALDSRPITLAVKTITIMLNKPIGYVCSRNGQGSRTVYDLLPTEFHHLKLVGRLDKDSSGLLLMTNDGQLAHELTHPRFQKEKVYEVHLNKPLSPKHQQVIKQGVMLVDGMSRMQLYEIRNMKNEIRGTAAKNPYSVLHISYPSHWQVTLAEGKNRQIRRTFEALGYTVTSLHRTQFGLYNLAAMPPGKYGIISSQSNQKTAQKPKFEAHGQ